MQIPKKQALLSWMSKVLHLNDVPEIQMIRNSELLIKLCNKIPGINLTYNSKYQDWKDSYMHLKLIIQELDSYMKNIIKYKFPNAISTMNLVQMAKGQDDQGLVNLLILIFLISFNLGPENSQVFVEKAIMLSESHQQQLMDLVKNNQIPRYQQGQMQQFQEKYQKQRQKVKEMISVLQNLTLENESLKQALVLQADETKKVSDQLKKVIEERDKIKKQLLQNYRIKDEQEPSKTIMNEHQEQIIEELKSNLILQQQNYGKQIFNLKQKIQSLEDQLQVYKNKIMEFQQNNFRQTAADHSNCTNRQVYKRQLSDLNRKLTEASSKQWKTKLQNIRLNNFIEELQSKNKKLLEQNKNKQTIITGKQNLNQIKFQVLKGLRDKLKSKMQHNIMYKQKRKQQKANNLEAMILDDPDINN